MKIFFPKSGLFFALIFLSANSCDLFDLRSPQDPAGSRSSFVEPFLLTDVPENLVFSFSDGSSSNFKKCLSSQSYSFIPSPEFQTELSGLTAEDEENIFKGLINTGLNPKDHISIEWSEIVFENQIDSTEWKANYKVFAPGPNLGSFEGKIILNLRKESDNLWYISKWRDFSVSGERSWSELKLKFSK